MSAMSKLELATCLRAEEEISHKDAQRIVELFFGTITTTLLEGEDVTLSGFGQFTLRNKAARPGRNPKTGEEVVIGKRRVVLFRAGKVLKKRVNRG